MKVYDVKTIGTLVKQRRKKLHYTQATVSKYTGLSKSFISDVENGKPTIELGKLIFLMNSLGMDLIVEGRG